MESLLINGQWMAAERVKDIVNPYTHHPVGRMSLASVHHVEEALRHAKNFRSSLTAYDRAEILGRAAAAIETEADEFAVLISSESGMALKDARKEVSRASAFLRYCAEEAKRITGEAIRTDVTGARTDKLAVTVREPVGLVCAITPFNRPLNQVVVKVAPAIAANNPVVLKPSEKTPLTAVKFVKTLLECGLPSGMVSVITGDPNEIGDALVCSPLVNLITFTGSSSVGESIARKAGMVRTMLELGDSGALIVLEDADLEAAARAGAAGAFSNAGQSCRGVKRILVHERVADEFVRLLAAEAAKLHVGDPLDPRTDIGTLISEQAAIEVERRVQEAVEAGAVLVYGGRRQGAQYWPTVLDHVDRHLQLVREETFGPCAPVIRIKDLEDAIACVNESSYGLQTGIFTRDIHRAIRAGRELQVGAVIINGGPQFESPNIPFGGVKRSGLGREGAKYAIEEMTVVKTIVL